LFSPAKKPHNIEAQENRLQSDYKASQFDYSCKRGQITTLIQENMSKLVNQREKPTSPALFPGIYDNNWVPLMGKTESTAVAIRKSIM
jgi:hypothetical protein